MKMPINVLDDCTSLCGQHVLVRFGLPRFHICAILSIQPVDSSGKPNASLHIEHRRMISLCLEVVVCFSDMS